MNLEPQPSPATTTQVANTMPTRNGAPLERLTRIIFDNGVMTYRSLCRLRNRATMNGNWGRLGSNERSLFRCAMWVAKIRGQIRNEKLMTQVLRTAIVLLKNLRIRILSVGRSRAQSMLSNFEQAYKWAPQLKEWLADPSYVWYLGVMGVNSR
jgi:hypothetical protein